MKLPMICCALLLALLYMGEVKGQTPLTPSEIAAFINAVAPGQSIRFVRRGGGGYQLHGPEGNGSIVPSGNGWTISYGKTFATPILRNGTGWTVYGKKTVQIHGIEPQRANFSGGRVGVGRVAPSGSGLTIYQGGYSPSSVLQSGDGWTIHSSRR